MIKILSIGNSFSQDAQCYLHDMAKCGGINIKNVNLYIGGCSLKTHWENAKQNFENYEYELNGQTTGKHISIKQALKDEIWDFITLQQASHDSGMAESYYPHLTELSEYVKKYAPNSVQLIHQTWAYETNSTHDAFSLYDHDQKKMYTALKAAYKKAAKTIKANIIPCGDVIQKLRSLKEFDYENGGQSLCRDGFHMHLIYGRYALAATWFESVFKGNILNDDFLPKCDDNILDIKLIDLIKHTVHNTVNGVM